MKRAIRNFIIELICYVVVLAILVVVVGLLLGWSLEMIITQVITFSFGWAVVKIIAILLEMRDRKEDKMASTKASHGIFSSKTVILPDGMLFGEK